LGGKGSQETQVNDNEGDLGSHFIGGGVTSKAFFVVVDLSGGGDPESL
jgi:hypothetical protein